MLLPMTLLWVWEERLRGRELRGWRSLMHQQQQHEQQQRERERQQAAGSSQQPGRQRQQGSGELGAPALREGSPPPEPGDLPRPVSWNVAWFAASSWLLWQLLEAVLL